MRLRGVHRQGSGTMTAAGPSENPGLRILVVDDDPGIRSLLGMTLAAEEWDVHMAGNGEQALEVVRSTHPFDLIVLDLQMPVMDGRTFYRRMRELPCDSPVLLLSAYGAASAQL